MVEAGAAAEVAGVEEAEAGAVEEEGSEGLAAARAAEAGPGVVGEVAWCVRKRIWR